VVGGEQFCNDPAPSAPFSPKFSLFFSPLPRGFDSRSSGAPHEYLYLSLMLCFCLDNPVVPRAWFFLPCLRVFSAPAFVWFSFDFVKTLFLFLVALFLLISPEEVLSRPFFCLVPWIGSFSGPAAKKKKNAKVTLSPRVYLAVHFSFLKFASFPPELHSPLCPLICVLDPQQAQWPGPLLSQESHRPAVCRFWCFDRSMAESTSGAYL